VEDASVTLEAASFPHRVAGRVLPIDEPGTESRVYRQPIGVIGVISHGIPHVSLAPFDRAGARSGECGCRKTQQ